MVHWILATAAACFTWTPPIRLIPTAVCLRPVCSSMVLSTILAASFLCGSFPATSVAGKPSPTAQVPLWKLDVRALGYVRYTVADPVNRKAPLGQFSFTEPDRIVVTFVSHISSDALSIRDKPDRSSLRLHAFFLDARTGQLQTTQEWPTPSLRSGIIPTTEGKFIVVRPDKLVLYSSGLQLLK